MADPEPASAEAMVGPDADPTPWASARGVLEDGRPTYWLATVRPDGRPHVMPLLGVWVEGRLYFCAGEGTRKARNLARHSTCVVTVEEGPLDLVVEGEAVKARDEATLRRVAEAYAAVYGWRVTVRDGAFTGTEGAPTAGPPPYDVYEVTPAIAFGFGTDETLTPTRWRF
jgi:Pyridoxamine 5'-phosphate oxidase